MTEGEIEYRQPPHNLLAEQALLGALLVNNEAYDRVCDFLMPEHFFEDVHARLYFAISQLIDEGKTADPVKLKPDFEGDEALEDVGGTSYIVRLAASAASIINAQDYAMTIRDLAVRREMITIGEDLVLSSYDAPVDVAATQIKEIAEESLYGLETISGAVKARAADAVSRATMEAIDAACRSDEPVGTRIVHMPSFDRLIGGCAGGELIIMAGRPAMGKSTLACGCVRGAAQGGEIAALFSYEMSERELACRMISDLSYTSTSGFEYQAALQGELNMPQQEMFVRSANQFSDLPIYVVDRPVKLPKIKAECRSIERRAKKKLGLVVIDYLQLIPPSSRYKGNKVAEISEITRELKNLARDMDIPIIALSQLSRGVESRENKKPMLSDLRESGSIEQDADKVIFVYREEYYLEKEEPDDQNSPEYDTWLNQMEMAKDRCLIMLSKNRNGKIGKKLYNVSLGHNAFREIDSHGTY